MRIDMFNFSSEETCVGTYVSDFIPRIGEFISFEHEYQYEVMKIYHSINLEQHNVSVLIVKEIVHV